MTTASLRLHSGYQSLFMVFPEADVTGRVGWPTLPHSTIPEWISCVLGERIFDCAKQHYLNAHFIHHSHQCPTVAVSAFFGRGASQMSAAATSSSADVAQKIWMTARVVASISTMLLSISRI